MESESDEDSAVAYRLVKAVSLHGRSTRSARAQVRIELHQSRGWGRHAPEQGSPEGSQIEARAGAELHPSGSEWCVYHLSSPKIVIIVKKYY